MKRIWKAAGTAALAASLALTGTLAVAADEPTSTPQEAPLRLGGRLGDRRGGPQSDGVVCESVAKALGMTVDELRTQLRDGVTLADLAEDQNVDLAKLRELAQSDRKAGLLERIQEALDDGSIDQDVADWYQTGIDEGWIGASRTGQSRDVIYEAAAKALDMTAEEVELQLWAGRTLADLADKAGVDLADVQVAIENAQQAERQQRIEQAVKDGDITQEQADWLLTGIKTGYEGLHGLGLGPKLGLGAEGQRNPRP
ncbi:MAG: hypothetical protein ABFD20_10010 [Anaerolineales bacterium]